MTMADSRICFFCAAVITKAESTTRVPSLGITVHSRCYQRDVFGDDDADAHGGSAAEKPST